MDMRATNLAYDGNFDDDMKELMGKLSENRRTKAPVYRLAPRNTKEEDLEGDMILVEFDAQGYVCWASCNQGLSEEQDGPWPGPVRRDVHE